METGKLAVLLLCALALMVAGASLANRFYFRPELKAQGDAAGVVKKKLDDLTVAHKVTLSQLEESNRAVLRLQADGVAKQHALDVALAMARKQGNALKLQASSVLASRPAMGNLCEAARTALDAELAAERGAK